MSETSAAAAPLTPAYRRKLFWVALLYFSEGLPLGVFYDIFPVYFRQQGVNLADIGLLSLLGLAWTLKFLWAPAVDWARRHRWWIAAANLGMAIVMWTFAASAGFGPWVWVAIGCFTMLSATNDIATDGYTIELLDKREYGLANGFRIGFYRVGMLTAGAVLMVSGWFGWSLAYLLAGAVFVLNAGLVLLAPREPARPGAPPGSALQELRLLREQPLWVAALALVLLGLVWPALPPLARAFGWPGLNAWGSTWWFRGAIPVALMFAGAALMVRAAHGPEAHRMKEGPVFGAWVELLTRPGMIGVIVFILLFKLGDAAMGFMVKPFWVDSGFSNEKIGLVSVNLGLAFSIAGGLVGGWYVDRVGIFRGLWVLGLWQALSNLGYALAAWYVPRVLPGADGIVQPVDVAWSHQLAVYAASALESFTGGLGTGAFLAFLMGITHRARATTEYAILSSIFAFSRAVAGWAGGLGAQEMGYAAYFFLTFWLSFPAYALLPLVRRMLEPGRAQGV
ncbi:MAG: MFS transporter [Pseudomonadota bacterium]|uniref:MFS transporter n=1 Tax=Caldimonas aquatica TaxID=376175 RepID=A0ABY6MSV4_9BURK|nr:MFS transporter [Schlegelella aquatica]UZD55097.1 MFS transporter [Schlegelella aquatica]